MAFSSAIEACRVPDELLAGAYEGTSALHRSWIKTTLALAEAVFPALPSRSAVSIENRAAGFGSVRTETAAPWTVLLIGAGYASAVRLAAAIMPARLAGVEPIIAVWTGKPEAAPSALFAALELTGVEQVFAMPDPAPLLGELPGQGRVLAFGAADVPPLPCPCWRDRPLGPSRRPARHGRRGCRIRRTNRHRGRRGAARPRSGAGRLLAARGADARLFHEHAAGTVRRGRRLTPRGEPSDAAPEAPP